MNHPRAPIGATPKPIQLDPCEACADILRRVKHDNGPEEMARVVVPTMRACPSCFRQFPASMPKGAPKVTLRLPNK